MGTPPLADRQFTFRRRHRLSRDAEYARVLKRGVRKPRGPITVVGLPSGRAESRLGLSIGRRAGGAVTRNAVKRRLREAFRLIRGEFERPVDLVVTARRHEVMTRDRYVELLRAGWRAVERELAKRDAAAEGGEGCVESGVPAD